MKNYYKTLGISQNASLQEIKKAYIQLAVKYHPDKNPGDNLSEQFKEISEAKQVLLNDLKKFQYDMLLTDFLSKQNSSFKFNNIRGKRINKRIFKLDNIKKTVFNKHRLLVAILFSVAILISAAFFQIPPDESTYSSAISEKSTLQPKKELLEAKAIVPYSPFVNDKKATQKINVPDKISKPEPVAPAKKIKNIKSVSATKKLPKKKGLALLSAPDQYSLHNGKAIQKQLNTGDMMRILNDIRSEKEQLGNNSNCVQIIKTKNSNIRSAFMLARFLRNYGFVISGREKADGNGTGIKINARGNCIKIVLATL